MSASIPQHRLLVRALTGLIMGALIAFLFSAFAAFAWIVNDRSLGDAGTTLGATVLGYFLWGPIVGLVVGLVFNHTRNRFGAAVVGAFVMVTAYLIFARLLDASIGLTVFVALGGAVTGAIGGIILFPRTSLENSDHRQGDQ